MTIVWFILIPLIGGLVALVAGRFAAAAARVIALAATAAGLGLSLALWYAASPGETRWIQEINDVPWVPSLGIEFHLAVDGLSLLMIVLTFLLGLLSVLTSWREIQEHVGFFFFNLLWVLSGVCGVFMALDLFLFYFFWELMLIPMFLLIAIWGHENRSYAAIKFFLFTQASGLLMLLSILGLVFIQYHETNILSFDYDDLIGNDITGPTSMLLMLGFFIAFAVKLPAIPFHTWLPDAHTEAPTAGSVILAGLLLKTGAYGLLRFALPLFPEASAAFAPVAMTLGAFGVLYGAVLAFVQIDLKRLVAYTSVSHLGFVLLGIYAGNMLAYQGVVMQMICHGLSTGGLFILVGALQERLHTRDIHRLGGLWAVMPKMGAAALIMALASLGLPGLGNFIAEMLTLFGTYKEHITLTVIASLGLVLATMYALRIIQNVFHGENTNNWQARDLGLRELFVMAVIIGSLVWLGLHPAPVLDTARPTLELLVQDVPMIAQLEVGE